MGGRRVTKALQEVPSTFSFKDAVIKGSPMTDCMANRLPLYVSESLPKKPDKWQEKIKQCKAEDKVGQIKRRCLEMTCMGKDYCKKHVFHNPYVATILADIALMEKEVKRVKEELKKCNGVEKFNFKKLGRSRVIDDLMSHITLTPMSVRKLAHVAWLDYEVAMTYVKLLAKRRRVVLGKNVHHKHVEVTVRLAG